MMNTDSNQAKEAERMGDCCVGREPTVGEALDKLIKDTEFNAERLRSLRNGLSLDYLGKAASAFPILPAASPR
jgi:hypothetical protein